MRCRLRVSLLSGIGLLVLAAAAAAQTAPRTALVGGPRDYVVGSGDSLSTIAAKHGITPAWIADRNRLAPGAKLEPGQTLFLDNPHVAVLASPAALTINIAQRMLFIADGARVLGYPISVGTREWPTPVGAFTIAIKEIDPTWDVPVSIQREMALAGKPVITTMPPSPQNPLGTRWIGLSLPGIGIHGTNAPSSIYRYASHGCIRMHPDHILELFERVRVGMTGVLTYQPVVLAMIDGRAWLEVHPDPYRRLASPMARVRTIAAQLSATEMIDWTAVAAAIRRRDGRAEDVTRR